MKHLAFITLIIAIGISFTGNTAQADQLWAGAAKVDITNTNVRLVNDRSYVRALVIKNDATTAVIVSVDAVAIGEIGHIKNGYLPNVRAQIKKELGIEPKNMMFNASHCHSVVSADADKKTIQAIKEAYKKMVPVTVGTGTGHENRIMENRRLILKNGKEIDVRHAYSLPPDEEVAKVGPIDPEIGILRLDKKNGETLAVVYNFACHPIQGVPNGGNTADMTGFSSKVIEENSSEGTIALFVQGCGGDINPIRYKHVDNPRHAEPLGNMLGLSTLRALKKIKSHESGPFKVINETLALPRADNAERIALMEAEQDRLLRSLGGTSLNLKTFIPLMVKYKVSGDFPSYYSHGYLHEKMIGRDDLSSLDAENRRNLAGYIRNIHTMEQLTRTQINLRLLRKHQANNVAAGSRTIDVEVCGLRIGEFVLITFPGELTVQIGLNIKKHSPHKPTFVAGYTNGYIYYSPTADQLRNVGGAQEDSDCLLAPEWQAIFEAKVAKILGRL